MPRNLRTISFRCSIEESILFEQLASSMGFSRSQLFRLLIACANAGLMEPEDIAAARPLAVRTDIWMDIWATLKRFGTNHNQGVKALNTAALFFERGTLSPSSMQTLGSQLAHAERDLRTAKEGIAAIREALGAVEDRMTLIVR